MLDSRMGRNFWLYAVGRWISRAGWVVQDVAVPLYVLDKTGSGAMMSLFVMAELIPGLVVNPIAGVVGDRYDRKKLMYGLDIARGILLFAVIAFNLLGIYQLLALQVVMSVMGAFFSAGIVGMFPDLVEREQLARANSILQSGGQVIRILGPILGGLIYALGGIKLAILINAVSFFGSGLFEVLIDYRRETRELSSLREVWSEMLDGFRFIKGSKNLMVFVSFGVLLNTLLNPVLVVVIPYLARVELGLSSVQFGSVETVATLGALAGNLLIALKLGQRSEGMLFRALFTELACLTALAFVTRSILGELAYPALLVTICLIGFFNTLVNVPLFTKLQKAVPDDFRSRFFTALETVMMATTPLGMALVGPLLDAAGVTPVVLALTIPSVPIALYYYLRFGRIVISIGSEKLEVVP
ncbi:Permeases of the major facilitator superfamily [Thermococcus nautili]|uniref:MFS transporter n=1 Tax=Thermococcus nautili TaxID=195522 RepID=UPI00255549F2|nr:MFS transporter [Thermococcus nautili]CAI1493832.1 Permeases of the major facilitator superfamily [Thermococcus nautili]